MRIGAGAYRGRPLKTPKGAATRPTSGMVRETLFNILAPLVPDARVLDLFAGCGSVGLEALSRGASHATFVEQAAPALACLRDNIALLGVGQETTVLPLPVERALRQLAARGEPFDIIFLDPPFADVSAYTQVLEAVAAARLLAPDGTLIAQHAARAPLPDAVPPLTRHRLRPLGDNALSFYRYGVECV